MATAIRAFLMLRRSGQWTVSVHRDLEDLVATWSARQEPEKTCGVLHVGFDRPPSQEFDEFAEGREGRLLVTASARHSLPAAFGTSDGAVGHLGALAVFLGTRGWGYVVHDAELPAVSASPKTDRPNAFSGWLLRFVTEHPTASDALREHSIFDDADYVAREALLAPDLRKEVGIYRLEMALAGDHSDPCAVSRAAPPWLSYRTFDSLNPGVRVMNVFHNLKIKTVSDLSVHSSSGLLQTQNFGRKSLNELRAVLEAAIAAGPQPDDPFEHEGVTSTLIDSIKRSLFKYDDRSRNVMLRRMGLGQPPETLQDLGERYNVSRERIRQIEAKATRRLIREEIWDDVLTQKLMKLLTSRRMPLVLKGIEGADPWFAGLGEEAYALRYLLANVSEGPAKVIRIDEIDYLGLIDQEAWDQVVSEARTYLEGGADSGWSEADCRAGVDALLPESCSEFRDLLWEQASRLGQFIEGPGGKVLVSYGRGAETIVQAVLAASPNPLHYTEIATLATERAGREIDARRAHNAAASIAYLFGRGVYGLDRHIPVSQAEAALIAEQTTDIVFEGEPGRQWHTNELVAELFDRGVECAPLNKYLLDVILRNAGQLERLGRLVWRDARSASADKNRIDIRQAIIATLHEAGAPLSADEIRRRVREVRGVNGAFQIHPIDPIIRVAHSTWGLNDRDIPIKRPDQPKVLGALVDILGKRGSGVHESELKNSEALSKIGLTVPALFSLAMTDNRLRTNTGRFLYLAEWEGPRRESIAEAVRSVMQSAAEPMSLVDISRAVHARVRREVTASAVLGCLQALDAHYDASSLTWAPPTTQENEIAEVDDDEPTSPVQVLSAT